MIWQTLNGETSFLRSRYDEVENGEDRVETENPVLAPSPGPEKTFVGHRPGVSNNSLLVCAPYPVSE